MTKHKSHQGDGADAPQPADEGKVPITAGAADSPATPPAAEAEPIQQLRAELAEAKDRALRYQAELDNYRKRAHRQIDEERRYANLPLMRDLLPVYDNVHRAIEAAEKSPDPAGLMAGFKLVAQQLKDVLARHHCEPIEAMLAPFDPHLHQAIGQQPSEEHPASTVLLVAQTGFQLHDRVVRPSQVIVSTTNNAQEKE